MVECTTCSCQTFMFAFMPTVSCFSGKNPSIGAGKKTNEWRDQSKLQILRRMNFFKRMGLPNKIVFFCSPAYVPIPFRCIPDSTLTYQLLGVSFKYVIFIKDFSSIRVSLTLSCPMNLKLYPLDRQMCPMQIASCKQSNFKTF